MMKYATVFEYGNHDAIAETRPAHREYLGKLKEAGQLAASGPFTDDSGALIIYEAESEEEAVELIENDPFRKAGVFKAYTIKPWNQVF
jgi:uncharacterized protein YciI